MYKVWSGTQCTEKGFRRYLYKVGSGTQCTRVGFQKMSLLGHVRHTLYQGGAVSEDVCIRFPSWTNIVPGEGFKKISFRLGQAHIVPGQWFQEMSKYGGVTYCIRNTLNCRNQA